MPDPVPQKVPDASTRLAADRTRLALERTLMAWVRTCTSMIAFGFGIYQFLRYLETKESLRQPVISPQLFAVLLIVEDVPERGSERVSVPGV